MDRQLVRWTDGWMDSWQEGGLLRNLGQALTHPPTQWPSFNTVLKAEKGARSQHGQLRGTQGAPLHTWALRPRKPGPVQQQVAGASTASRAEGGSSPLGQEHTRSQPWPKAP